MVGVSATGLPHHCIRQRSLLTTSDHLPVAVAPYHCWVLCSFHFPDLSEENEIVNLLGNKLHQTVFILFHRYIQMEIDSWNWNCLCPDCIRRECKQTERVQTLNDSGSVSNSIPELHKKTINKKKIVSDYLPLCTNIALYGCVWLNVKSKLHKKTNVRMEY